MAKLLKLYFFRLFKSTSFYVFLIICGSVGLMAGLIHFGIVYGFSHIAGGEESGVLKITLLSALSIMFGGGAESQAMGSFGGVGIIAFPAFLIIFSINFFFHMEISMGTFRNQIVSGYSRKQIYLTYYLGNLVHAQILGFAFIIARLLPILFLISDSGFTSELAGPFFMSVGFSILFYLMIASFTFFLIVGLNGNGGVIPLSIGIHLVLAIAGFLLPMLLAYIFKRMNMDDHKSMEICSRVLAFLPTTHGTIISTMNYHSAPTVMSVMAGPIAPGGDWTAFNVLVILLEELAITIGSFFFGLLSFSSKELK